MKNSYSEYPMQWYALSFTYCIGLVANDFFFQSLFCLFLFYLFSCSRDKHFYFATLFCLLFGFFYGAKADIPKAPSYFAENEERKYTAQIESVHSLADRRLRLVLKNVREQEEKEFFKGKLVLYLYYESDVDHMPLPHMQIDFTSRIRPVHFSKNKGIMSADQYWFDRNIFYTSFISLKDKDTDEERTDKLFLSGEGSFLSTLRNTFYQNFVYACKKSPNSLRDFLQRREGNMTQAKAFILALTFGERFYVETKTSQLFVKTSLVHTIALSGMHLAFTFLCASFLIKIIAHIYPSLFLLIPKQILIASLAMLLSLCYLWIGNAPMSLIRASTMFFFVWLFLCLRKNLSLLDSLMLALTSILLCSPRTFGDIGFQLSAFSVFAIALSAPFFYPLREYLSKRNPEKRLRYKHQFYLYSLSIIWISLCIQVFLYPIQASVFALISPYFGLNLLWLPLLQIALPLAFLGLISISLPFSSLFIVSASFIIDSFISFLQYLDSSFNLSMIQVYRPSLWQSIGFYTLLIGSIYFFKIKNKKYILLLGIICLVTEPLYKHYARIWAKEEERMSISVLDVGQGQSILLEWSDKKALIDAGGVYGDRFDTGRDILAKILTYQDFPHLDYAFISHFDLDHAKGFFHLVRHFSIGTLLYSEYNRGEGMRKALLGIAKERSIEERALKSGDIIVLEPNVFYIEVLFPYKTQSSENFSSNNSSLVLRLVHKGKGLALFCGDIEQRAIKILLEKNIDLSADLLVLPHHGARSSYNTEFYERVNPREVAISAGKYNRFGFPAQEIIEYFTEHEISIKNTADLYALEYEFF